MTSPAAEPPEPAVVVVNPDETVTAEAFQNWLDRRASAQPIEPGTTAADTLAQARAAGEA
jgi:hypothetical protein